MQLGGQGGAVPGGAVRVANDYVQFTGDVRCVTVDGSIAWVAGAVTRGDALGAPGWAARLVDGGSPAAEGDAAILYLDELDVVMDWCAAADLRWDADAMPEPVTRGNLTVSGR